MYVSNKFPMQIKNKKNSSFQNYNFFIFFSINYNVERANYDENFIID